MTSPANRPAPFSVRITEGVAVVSIDVLGGRVNTLGAAAMTAWDGLLTELDANPAVQGVVLISGKPDSFVAGADINEFERLTTAEAGEALSRAVHAVLDRVERSRKPVVVAIHGVCLGLGLELALACHSRIASDHEATKLGLPEVQLGVIPGGGGCVRLPRLIGARAALDIILAGKSVRASKALAQGLVDEVVPASILETVAVGAARRLADRRPAARRPPGGLARILLDGNPLGRWLVYRGARRQVEKKTGGHYPAPLAALDVVKTGLERGRARGFEEEARQFGRLAVSSVSRELVRIFFATSALKKAAGAGGTKVTELGVVGAGFMGAAIAGTAAATAGIEVRLKDTDLPRVGRGIAAAVAIVRDGLTRKRISRLEFERRAALISGGNDYRGLGRADLVIEAVFEDLTVKQAVFAELEAATRPDAILASNTSTLPITRIAESASRPERIVGVHFFSPVERMPLVEVIPGERTDPVATATAVRLAQAMGKTAIVVADRPGFWVNRILPPYLIEAARLLLEGTPIDVIDRIMVRFGFPVGPFALLDEVGLDVASKAGRVMEEAFGERMTPAPALDRMVAAGRLGRKAQKGFYLYHRGHKTDPDPEVYRLLGVTPLATVRAELVERRLVYPLLNEAARACAEGVVASPRDGDLGAIFGIGFPPFRGGPLRMIDQMPVATLVAGLEELTAT